MKRLTFDDHAEARAWLESLRVSFDDIDAVALDMLRPARRRNLGPREHRRLYREARGKVVALLASPSNDTEPEHGDPAGSGGSGAE